MSDCGWARVALDPADADGETTLSLDDLRSSWRADVEAAIDAATAELGLGSELRAEMMARALALIGPHFDAWGERARQMLRAFTLAPS